MKPIPLTRNVFLAPFTSILNEMGAPTPSLLAKFHLPIHPEENTNQYIPLFPALRFLAAAEVSQGVIDFGFLAGQRLSFGVLSDRFQATVHRSPTLLAALKSWCRFVQLEDTFLRVRLERHEHSLRVCYTSTFPEAEGIPRREHAQWLQNIVTIHIVRQFAGPHWTPATFAFQSRYSPSAETQSFWANTRFVSGQNASWIDIPVSILTLHNPVRDRARNQSQIPFRPIKTDIVSTLKMILPTYFDEHVPNIAEAAEIIGTSVRSLQRELSAANLTYSSLLDQVRFELGIELLRKTDVKISDAAYATGYANPTHFTRAFRRFVGVTPREFREKLSAH